MGNTSKITIGPKTICNFLKEILSIGFCLKLVVLLLTLYTFTSCSSDDGDYEEEVTIVETWTLSSAALNKAQDFNKDGIVSPDLFTETNCEINGTITFKSDGTGTWKISKGLFMLYDEAADTYEAICNPLDETYGLLELEWTQTGSNRSFRYTTPNESVSVTGIVTGSNLSIPFELAILTDDGLGGTILHDTLDGTNIFDLE